MPTVVVIGNIRIRLYPNDHNPPHFHIVTGSHKASVSIKTGRILAGTMPEAHLRIALRWAEANREFLENEWARLTGRDK